MFKPLPTTRSCFVCGQHNATGLKLKFETDGVSARTTFIPAAAFSGFTNVIHGGILSTVLDEVMVWGCAVAARRFCYCAELTVRFQAPAKPSDVLIATGRLDSNRRNRIFEASGEIVSAVGTTIACASGKYMPIAESEATRLFADFEDGAATLFQGISAAIQPAAK